MNADDLSEPVNPGNPAEYAIVDLAMEIARLCETSAAIEYCPLPQDDPKRRQRDISRARERLDWTPAVPLHEGLRRTIDYFAEQIGGDAQVGMPRQAAARTLRP